MFDLWRGGEPLRALPMPSAVKVGRARWNEPDRSGWSDLDRTVKWEELSGECRGMTGGCEMPPPGGGELWATESRRLVTWKCLCPTAIEAIRSLRCWFSMATFGPARGWEAAQRREEREAQRRLRELDRRRKEEAKLSAQEAARLEVESYEAQLEVLLSVHKAHVERWDWVGIASSLPPHSPQRFRRQELISRRRSCVTFASGLEASADEIEEAVAQDELHFQEASEWYRRHHEQWANSSALARRILTGDEGAYLRALRELNQLNEVATLGSSLRWTVHGPRLLECRLKVHSVEAIPKEVKSLAASGKLSVKPMAQARFQELYQDYICSCILRVGREAFALLPIETVLVTALVDITDHRTGHPIEESVLSVALNRVPFEALAFERLDPSDAVATFLHRGDFKATRKGGAFVPIAPLVPADLPRSDIRTTDPNQLLEGVRKLREALKAEIAEVARRLGQQELPDSLVT